MHHIPKRKELVNVNPWPAALRRLGWLIGAFLVICSVPLLTDWIADQFVGEKRHGFPISALALLIAGIGLLVYLVVRRRPTEILSVKYNYTTHYLSALLFACISVYLMWSGMYTDAMDRDNPASYPYPYHGSTLLVCNWICTFLAILMVATVVRALRIGFSNRYEEDDEPL